MPLPSPPLSLLSLRERREKEKLLGASFSLSPSGERAGGVRAGGAKTLKYREAWG
jgi:hypothetical protein